VKYKLPVDFFCFGFGKDLLHCCLVTKRSVEKTIIQFVPFEDHLLNIHILKGTPYGYIVHVAQMACHKSLSEILIKTDRSLKMEIFIGYESFVRQ